jgi:hypothetical protein
MELENQKRDGIIFKMSNRVVWQVISISCVILKLKTNRPYTHSPYYMSRSTPTWRTVGTTRPRSFARSWSKQAIRRRFTSKNCECLF